MGNKFLAFLSVAATFIIAVCWKNDFIRFLLGFELLVSGFAFLEVFFLKNKVKAYLVLPETVVYKGEPFQIKAHLCNLSRIPIPQIRVEAVLRDRWAKRDITVGGAVSLDGREEGTLNFSFDPGYCGAYEAEVTHVICWDHLGVFKYRKKAGDHARTLYVLPEAATPGIFDTAFGNEESDGSRSEFRKGRSAVDTSDIREYRKGDMINHIYWKLSAKMMQLMVREMGEPLEKMNRIYLNLQYQQEELTRAEWEEFLNFVAELSAMMLNGQRPHFVCWIDIEIEKLIEYRVSDGNTLQEMLCGLLFARAWRAGEKANVLEEIRWDETMEENIEVNLKGEIVSSGE